MSVFLNEIRPKCIKRLHFLTILCQHSDGYKDGTAHQVAGVLEDLCDLPALQRGGSITSVKLKREARVKFILTSDLVDEDYERLSRVFWWMHSHKFS